MVDGEPTNPSGKAFVEPEFAPPVHSDQVAKPLVSQFVGHNVGNVVFKTGRGGLFIIENALKILLAV